MNVSEISNKSEKLIAIKVLSSKSFNCIQRAVYNMRFLCNFRTNSSGTFINAYSCFVKSIENKEAQNVVDPVGIHFVGMKHADVEFISIENIALPHFPRGLAAIFPRLKIVRIVKCGLTKITNDDLAGLEGITVLNVNNNSFNSIPSDLFKGMAKLKKIIFHHNQIEFASSQLLEPLIQNDLSIVDFRFNKSLNMAFNKEAKDKITMKLLMGEIDGKCKRPIGEEQKLTSAIKENQYAGDLEMLWKSGRYSDFTVIADGPLEFRVHKFVLGIRSPVFDAMFNAKMVEQFKGSVTIQGYASNVIKQFLAYFYTGRIQDESCAMELYELAGMYDVPQLRAMMEKIIIKNVNEWNAYEVFTVGHHHSSDAIKDAAFLAVRKMCPGKSLQVALLNEPERLKKLVEAARSRKRKIEEIDEEFDDFYKTFSKKNVRFSID